MIEFKLSAQHAILKFGPSAEDINIPNGMDKMAESQALWRYSRSNFEVQIGFLYAT